MGLKLFIMAWIAVLLGSAPAYPQHGLTVFVFDGDTILLKNGDRVRYLGIDTPEIRHNGQKSDFMAYAARKYNRGLVLNQKVRLEFDLQKEDAYGRLLAYVYRANGEMVNTLLLERGFAHVMVHSPNLRHFPLLLSCQRRAMAMGLGIWQKKIARQESYYTGNRKSFRFHRPTCLFGRKTDPRNVKIFENRRDAFWNGFSPCRRCRP
ncbi:MAG: thermonuclease family protein [Deltaproteobacteria bacterium]|nr:thermonuclease family protein [Deltaproteobacteria bacterium]